MEQVLEYKQLVDTSRDNLLECLQTSNYRVVALVSAERGYTDIIDHIHSLDRDAINDQCKDIWSRVARHGHLELAEWLSVRDYHPHPDTLYFTGVTSLGVLQLMYKNGCALSDSVCMYALSSDNFEILAWMREKGYPYSWRYCTKYCDSVGLRWCIDNGCPLTYDLYRTAIKMGDLDLFVLLHSRGCARNPKLCALMASRGRLDILEYAVKNGFYWKKDVCLALARSQGHSDVVRWIKSL